ncbi:hypothetical protein [Nostoc sp.]
MNQHHLNKLLTLGSFAIAVFVAPKLQRSSMQILMQSERDRASLPIGT